MHRRCECLIRRPSACWPAPLERPQGLLCACCCPPAAWSCRSCQLDLTLTNAALRRTPPPRRAVLALKAGTLALTSATLGWFSGHKGQARRVYVAYRELFIAASCLHLQWTVRLTGESGRSSGGAREAA